MKEKRLYDTISVTSEDIEHIKEKGSFPYDVCDETEIIFSRQNFDTIRVDFNCKKIAILYCTFKDVEITDKFKGSLYILACEGDSLYAPYCIDHTLLLCDINKTRLGKINAQEENKPENFADIFSSFLGDKKENEANINKFVKMVSDKLKCTAPPIPPPPPPTPESTEDDFTKFLGNLAKEFKDTFF